MKFTYEASLLCESRFVHHTTCAGYIAGETASVKVSEASALANATSRGWLQIGDKLWCPSCAEKRPQTDAMLKERAGKFVPTTGLRVRFAHPKAGALGHQYAAAQNLTEGECYTIATVLPGYGVLLVSLLEVPLFFNVEMFDEAIPTKATKKPRKTKP